MRTFDADAVLELIAGKGPVDADYRIVRDERWSARNAHLAVARSGDAALLIPVPRVMRESLRLTHGLALRGATIVEFVRGDERWRQPAAVIECRDPKLLRTFAAMASAITVRVDAWTQASFDDVTSLFAEWERLLARRQILSGESELGLWAELWCLSQSSRRGMLLDAWRGPDAEHCDFLLDGLAIEVKASRRIGSHFVSQAQVDEPAGAVPVVLMSLHVMQDPLRGRTLTELVGSVSLDLDDHAALEEKLASIGYSHDDAGAYSRRFAIVSRPQFFAAENIPRVRVADPGVSDLRYRVELRPDTALVDTRLEQVIAVLGLDFTDMKLPCA